MDCLTHVIRRSKSSERKLVKKAQDDFFFSLIKRNKSQGKETTLSWSASMCFLLPHISQVFRRNHTVTQPTKGLA